MDKSEYNFRKIKDSDEDGIFYQEFIDSEKHVKYVRFTWSSDCIDYDLLDNTISLSVGAIDTILPNVIKTEHGSNYYEILTFFDDDIEFNSKRLLPKFISNEIESRINGYGCNSIELVKEFNDAIKNLPKIPGYPEAIKEIYKNYIDKEL